MNEHLDTQLKKLIAEGYLREAMGQLRLILENNPGISPIVKSLLDETAIVSSNYESAERNFLLGKLSPENFQQAWAKTAAACLHLTNRLPEPLQKDVQPVKKKFDMAAHATKFRHRAKATGNRNIIVQGIENGNVHIHQSDGVKLKHILYLIAVIIALLIISGIIWQSYSGSESYQYENAIKSGNYDEYASYFENYGNTTERGKALAGILKNNPNILITGTWQSERPDDFHELYFFWEDNVLQLKMDGIVYDCILNTENPDEWLLIFPKKKNMGIWYLTKLNQRHMWMQMNGHAYYFNRK